MGKRKRRRSRSKRISDQVFQWTGIPLPRLLMLIAGLAVTGGLIFYLSQEEPAAQISSDQTDPQPLLFDDNDSEEKKFFDAITIPNNFIKLSLPVQIERLDQMISHCELLLSQETKYEKKLQQKCISLISLKCTSMVQSGLDPTPDRDQLYSKIDQFTESAAEEKEYVYLRLYVNLSTLMFNPESSYYNDVMKVIEEIDDTTPVQSPKVLGCYSAAIRYFNAANDKQKSAALLTALGQKISLAGDGNLSEYGRGLLDYPHYSKLFKTDQSDDSQEENFVKNNIELFEKLSQTPPQSTKTFDRLFLIPELFLQSGNTDAAKVLMSKIKAATATASDRIRKHVETKLNKGLARAALFDQTFPVEGNDTNGKPIKLSRKEKTLILFLDPAQKKSLQTLKELQDSLLNDRWSTDIFLVPVSPLSNQELGALKRRDARTRVLDAATSQAWLAYSGVNEIPYLITLGKNGSVRRLEQF